jgi:hypothetical protein
LFKSFTKFSILQRQKKLLHISKFELAKNIWGQIFPHQSPQKGKETMGA